MERRALPPSKNLFFRFFFPFQGDAKLHGVLGYMVCCNLAAFDLKGLKLYDHITSIYYINITA